LHKGGVCIAVARKLQYRSFSFVSCTFNKRLEL
jgi:hypothetical protein